MKKLKFLWSLAVLLLLAGCASQRVYIGGNDGIHLAQYSNFGLPIPRSWSIKKIVNDPRISYMALKGRTLYAARQVAKGIYCVDVYRVLRNGMLKKADAFEIPGNAGYCHLSVSNDGKYLFGSSYSGGFVDVLSLVPDGGIIRLKQRLSFSGRSIHKRQKKSHPHFAVQTPDGKKLFAADLGSDKIHIFACDGEKGLVREAPVALPPGSGPRHLSFSADGKFLFAANELNNTVSSFKMEKGRPVPVSVCSLLPSAWSGTSYAGAIKTAPDGDIYVTNRGHNSLAVVKAAPDGTMKLGELLPSEGDFPYDLCFSKGKLFLVNMKSDRFSVWEKNEKWQTAAAFTLRRPMCIAVPEP